MVRIITDSSSELSLQQCENLGVTMLPITISFGEESFRSLVDLTNRDFYKRLRASSELPKTVQISPAEFEEAFKPIAESGEETVCLFISSRMSGTTQSAILARDRLGAKNILIPDTLNVTFALGLLVLEAVKMRDRGLNAAQIAKEIELLVPRVRLFALVNDLKYLKMGGRLSATSALVAGVLGICPIITLKDGLVEVVGKARGKTAACRLMGELVEEEPPSLDYMITTGNADVSDTLHLLHEQFAAEFKKRELVNLEIGSIVGTNTGPGACGLAYIKK